MKHDKKTKLTEETFNQIENALELELLGFVYCPHCGEYSNPKHNINILNYATLKLVLRRNPKNFREEYKREETKLKTYKV